LWKGTSAEGGPLPCHEDRRPPAAGRPLSEACVKEIVGAVILFWLIVQVEAFARGIAPWRR
jgi:hypothetical protein